MTSSKLTTRKNHKGLKSFNLVFGWALRYEASGVQDCPILDVLPTATEKELINGSAVLWTDQGIGDEILQLGLIADLFERGEANFIATSDRLLPLVHRSFPTSTCLDRALIDKGELKKLGVSSQFPAIMIGSRTRKNFDDFPERRSYLEADTRLKEKLRQKYRTLGANRPVVGLAWRSANPEFGAQKSLDLIDLMPVLTNPDVSFVSLQYDLQDDEISNLPDFIRTRLSIDSDINPLKDLDSFAAQIASLDLVITTSNSTAHLAGALGISTWVLIPRMGPGWLWYWFRDREDSPWYPSVRLFRQSQSGDWNAPITAVGRRLAEFVSSRQRVTTN